MGREIKRVAVDFEWPLSKPWEGFVNPHYDGHCSNCTACKGSGLSPQAKRLQDLWYGNLPFHPGITGSEPFTETHPIIRTQAERNCKDAPGYYVGEHGIFQEAVRLANLFNSSWSHHLDRQDVAALLKADRLMGFTHTPRTLESNGYVPSPKEVNDWSISSFGHDGINSYIVVKAKCERLGLAYECEACEGEGSVWDSMENKEIAEKWKPREPPEGEGWQVWETVSEGSPVTPVFSTAEALADYLAQYGDDWDQKRGDPGWGHDAAAAFVGVGWVPSMVVKGGQVFESRDVALKMGR